MREGAGKIFCLLFFRGIIGSVLLFWGIAGEHVFGKGAENEQARISYLQGTADVLGKGQSSWKPLQMGSLLFSEDRVRTGEASRVEITFPDRSVLRFDQRSTFELNRISFDAQGGSRDIKTQLKAGRAWANVRKVFVSKKTFEVASSNAVAGVRDTVWRMDIVPDQSTLIRVYEGQVEVYNPFMRPDYKPEEGGFRKPKEVRGPQEIPRPYEEVSREQWEEIVLSQMMEVVIPAAGRPAKPMAFKVEEDRQEDWVRWNQQRDQDIIR
jgi:hypothetical protein